MTTGFRIPITTSEVYDVDALPAESLWLGYDLSDAPGGQSVTRGRLLAKPRLDLNDYNCKAVFDWIEF
ncbi:hypothetical protein [Roseivivax sp. THAF30]|uniref:hypothetical protein n=1 Tax=Roseivivax sp. THAF30 TaxID=2587852 RepID=UPI001267B155|nr:hypothetical protein [Roseivivax sp. THAF30]QFT62693.1 hypothetical protein FIU91_07115 [Roseivivax sp. THAF30]